MTSLSPVVKEAKTRYYIDASSDLVASRACLKMFATSEQLSHIGKIPSLIGYFSAPLDCAKGRLFKSCPETTHVF
jgi:hypothetical protein